MKCNMSMNDNNNILHLYRTFSRDTKDCCRYYHPVRKLSQSFKFTKDGLQLAKCTPNKYLDCRSSTNHRSHMHFSQQSKLRLKDYSVILTTSSYGVNQKLQQKKLIAKISVDYNNTFSSSALYV